jgi:hypothetical protein
MTSQRDEATRHPASEGMTDDDPIVIERRDEILASDDLADDGPGEDLADDGPGEDPAASGPGEDLAASDELVGRHAAPDTSPDPAPLVVPPGGPSPDMGVSPPPGPAMAPGAAASMAQPVAAGTPDAAVSAPPGDGGRGPVSGPPGAGIPAAALAEQQWPAIQAMFVDDPRGSVQRAAGAADQVLKALVASLEREQAALGTSWENGTEPTTEDLRTALQQYRAFCGRLEGLA